MRTPAAPSGFTLIEMLVVISVIIALMAMSYAAAMAMRSRNDIQTTEALLQGVLLALEAKETVPIPDPRDPTRVLNARFGDFDGNGILDGDPAKDKGFDEPHSSLGTSYRELAEDPSVDYRGFIEDSSITVTSKRVRDGEGRLVDAWGRPLRIVFGARIYGPSGRGVISDGPDRKPDTEDDIKSWELGKRKDA